MSEEQSELSTPSSEINIPTSDSIKTVGYERDDSTHGVINRIRDIF